MFYNVEDLAIEVVMELYKCLAILVFQEVRFLVLLRILSLIGRCLLIFCHRLEQVLYLLICFLDPLTLEAELV